MDTTIENPKTEYFMGEVPKQFQQPPALQSQMAPIPDCGEESYEGSGKLLGRKALITGGDSGIGRAAAIAYGREGADVAICYTEREEEDAREVKEHIENDGQKCVLLPGDLRDEERARLIVDTAAMELGGLDILVLNAGMQHAEPDIMKMDMDIVRATFETNIISMYYTVQQALKHMKEGSAIITTSSIEAYEPGPHLLDYAATKSAIRIFSEALSKQLIQKGIRVNSVAPGPIWTALQVGGGQTQEQLPHFGTTTPMGRAGQPVELAPVYVFLASGEASYITGQVYGVTGGLLTN